MNIFKIIILFVVCVFISASAVIGYRYRNIKTLREKSFDSQPSLFTQQPPNQSLKATLTVLAGEIIKFPRASTESATIVDTSTIVQGDGIKSDATSSAKVIFDSTNQMWVGANANIQYINTIPSEFLLWQQDGLVEYQATNSAYPVTIRSLSLLTTIASTSAKIEVNQPTGGMITITTANAPIKVAYQDKDANTYVIDIPASSSAVYNHTTRKVK